ncbi:MAG: hypothetical protein WD872_02215, partial [Pirellulaceae bacterium]
MPLETENHSPRELVQGSTFAYLTQRSRASEGARESCRVLLGCLCELRDFGASGKFDGSFQLKG